MRYFVHAWDSLLWYIEQDAESYVSLLFAASFLLAAAAVVLLG
jgi:hypothetical protein